MTVCATGNHCGYRGERNWPGESDLAGPDAAVGAPGLASIRSAADQTTTSPTSWASAASRSFRDDTGDFYELIRRAKADAWDTCAVRFWPIPRAARSRAPARC